MKKQKENIIFPKDFWTKPRQHMTEKEPDEDMIPFEWDESELPEKAKKILFKNEGKTK